MKMINEITNDTMAKFSHTGKGGVMYYTVETENLKYIFPIDTDDEDLPKEDKVGNFMKYLVDAIERGGFIKIRKMN